MRKAKQFQAQIELLHTMLQWLTAELPPEMKRQVELASEEALVNIITHAYQNRPESIELELCVVPESYVEIVFQDTGPPFDPTKHPPLVPRGSEEPGGLGIHFIRQNMDEVHYQRKEGKNILTMKKRWPITRSSRKK